MSSSTARSSGYGVDSNFFVVSCRVVVSACCSCVFILVLVQKVWQPQSTTTAAMMMMMMSAQGALGQRAVLLSNRARSSPVAARQAVKVEAAVAKEEMRGGVERRGREGDGKAVVGGVLGQLGQQSEEVLHGLSNIVQVGMRMMVPGVREETLEVYGEKPLGLDSSKPLSHVQATASAVAVPQRRVESRRGLRIEDIEVVRDVAPGAPRFRSALEHVSFLTNESAIEMMRHKRHQEWLQRRRQEELKRQRMQQQQEEDNVLKQQQLLQQQKQQQQQQQS